MCKFLIYREEIIPLLLHTRPFSAHSLYLVPNPAYSLYIPSPTQGCRANSRICRSPESGGEEPGNLGLLLQLGLLAMGNVESEVATSWTEAGLPVQG